MDTPSSNIFICDARSPLDQFAAFPHKLMGQAGVSLYHIQHNSSWQNSSVLAMVGAHDPKM